MGRVRDHEADDDPVAGEVDERDRLGAHESGIANLMDVEV
jgi:hypothetical protein